MESARVKDFLPDSLLDRLEAPLGAATGLPNAAYVSDEFFGLEQRYLFRRSWVLAGRADEIRGHGDIKPVDAGGVPVILVRGEGGEIRAFQNVCRHRGMRLVDACQQARQSIVCPYHAWSYDLAGRLRRRPHFRGGGIHDVVACDDAGLELFEVPLAQWHHWLFVNVDGNMAPLDEHFRFLDEKLAGYRIGAMAHAGALEFEIAANWKFVHENFIEPYHVFAAHPRLHTFVPMEERTPSFVEGHVLWNRYRFKHAQEGRGLGLPHFPDLDEEESAMQGIWFTVAPSFSIEIYPDHIAMFEVEPLAPDRSRERISIFLAPEAASGEQYARNRQAVFDMWEDLNREDIALLEGLQRGRAAPAYDGGVLSPYWDEAPRALARNLARTMREEAGRC